MKHKLIGATLMACAAMAGCTSAYSGATAPVADPAPVAAPASQAEVAPEVATPAAPADVNSSGLALGPGMEEVETTCSGCHAITVVTGKHYSEDHWVEVVDQMIGHGAYVPDDKFDVIVDYLIAHYGEN